MSLARVWIRGIRLLAFELLSPNFAIDYLDLARVPAQPSAPMRRQGEKAETLVKKVTEESHSRERVPAVR